MAIIRQPIARWLLVASLHLGLACEGTRTEIQTGLTGAILTINYEATLGLNQLRIQGLLEGAPAFPPALRPERPRALNASGQETVAIVLDEDDDGKDLIIFVDGLAGTETQASAETTVALEAGRMKTATVSLGAAETCGDGNVRTGVEECDDNGNANDDGCSELCQIEPGYVCAGEPSVCNPTCGNGVLDPGEECDDHDLESSDGCNDNCRIEPGFACTTDEPSVCARTCGDGKVDQASEDCDDGDLDIGDGCSASCRLEPGFACIGEPSVCAFTCGNGAIDDGEDCDDDNANPDDGCSANCKVEDYYECHDEPSVCDGICGDGKIRGTETCDDKGIEPGDGCSDLCQEEDGYACQDEPSVCDTVCGDGKIRGDEACDDENPNDNDGCSAACAIEDYYTCEDEPSICDGICGDGKIRGTEQCDDEDLEPGDGCDGSCTREQGWTCEGEPSVCNDCGNGTVEGNEVCDDNDFGGATCHSLGMRDGDLSCHPNCDTIRTNGCGDTISNPGHLKQAITEAYASDGHETISIHGGTYNLADTLLLDECDDAACTGNEPFGLTLQPLDDTPVVITMGAGTAVEVRTGNNVLFGLELRDTQDGIMLPVGPDAGGNTVSHMLFSNPTTGPRDTLQVGSDGNTIEANRFENASGTAGTTAIAVSGADSVIAMNAIHGPYAAAISVDTAGGTTLLDHNSLMLAEDLAGTGVSLTSSMLCLRNNIIYGDGTTIGYALDTATLGDAAACGGSATGNNVNLNHATDCNGADCMAACDGGGVLCDLTDDPGFSNAGLCLDAASLLIDAGLDLGYDLWDSDPLPFNSTAPEVGARESAVSRRFGGVVSNCP